MPETPSGINPEAHENNPSTAADSYATERSGRVRSKLTAARVAYEGGLAMFSAGSMIGLAADKPWLGAIAVGGLISMAAGGITARRIQK